VNYSPVVDINNNPDKFIVNFRTFGEDKDKVARYASAMMRGMRDGGLAGSAKHFPGHGETNVDSHLALPLLPFSAERLDSLELYPFRKLIADGVDMVMVGHLNVPALDPSGAPASISKPIVTGLLREKMGYDGIIITDALNMYGVARDSGLEKKDIPLAAYKAGVDILLMPEDVENAISQIENALEAGEITMEGLDMRVKKMLRLKARYGIFDKSYDPIVRDLDIFTDTTAPDARMKAKLSLIKKVSEETMTVVFNDNSQGLGLPVSCEGKKVAYVGFMNPQLGQQFGEVANRYGQVDTVLLGDDAALEELKAAKEKVSGYDLVIFGFNKSLQSIKRNFGLEEAHLKFITDWAADQPMVAVFLGSPYILKRMPGHENFKAFVVGYDANRFNNEAAAKVVFGVIPAKGILPVTTASFKVGEGVYIPAKQK
jgi:beta-glucosidase-like glycosyl hydrolase